METIYVTNNIDYIILKECCEDFGVELRFKNKTDSRAFYTLTGHPTNIYNAKTLYFINIKNRRK